MTMLDHIGLRTRQAAAMMAFYDKALAPLGYTKQMDFGDVAGYGTPQHPALWIGAAEQTTSPLHIALAAPNRSTVDAFHAAALAAGATDNGAPGLRPDYHPNYYGAFVIDPDGHNLEAVCHLPE
jgi:catechol 2,3-dioxygenase-like lactoylglutathione lyase family enzyme